MSNAGADPFENFQWRCRPLRAVSVGIRILLFDPSHLSSQHTRLQPRDDFREMVMENSELRSAPQRPTSLDEQNKSLHETPMFHSYSKKPKTPPKTDPGFMPGCTVSLKIQNSDGSPCDLCTACLFECVNCKSSKLHFPSHPKTLLMEFFSPRSNAFCRI